MKMIEKHVLSLRPEKIWYKSRLGFHEVYYKLALVCSHCGILDPEYRTGSVAQALETLPSEPDRLDAILHYVSQIEVR